MQAKPLTNLGVIYGTQGKKELEQKCYEKALTIYEAEFGSNCI